MMSCCTDKLYAFCLFVWLAMLHSLQDLISLTRDRIQAVAATVPNPSHWTARERPQSVC